MDPVFKKMIKDGEIYETLYKNQALKLQEYKSKKIFQIVNVAKEDDWHRHKNALIGCTGIILRYEIEGRYQTEPKNGWYRNIAFKVHKIHLPLQIPVIPLNSVKRPMAIFSNVRLKKL